MQYDAWLPRWAKLGMLVWAKVWAGKRRAWWPAILRPHQTEMCRKQHVWAWNLGTHDFSQVNASELLPFTGALAIVNAITTELC